MATTRRSTVVGVFDDSDRARDAIQELKDSGFPASDISILMKDRGRAEEIAEDTGTHAAHGAITGALSGGVLGGLAGWLVGMGALTIPGVGPVIAAGAFGTTLAGAGIGAGMGAVAGALVGMGIPQEEAEWYEGEVKQGRTLVTVSAGDRYVEAHGILSRHGAYDLENRYAGTAMEGGPGVPAWSEGQVVPPAATRADPEADEGVIAGDFPEHEHRFTGDVCEVCGTRRQDRRAA
ncbi:MAG TPA: general stress protein [Chloroflexota bacterium]